MTPRNRWTLIVPSLFFFIACATTSPDTSLAEIAAARSDYVAKLNRGDARAVAESWTEDMVYMPAGGATIRARNDLESVLRPFFAVWRETMTIKTEEVVVMGDLAYEFGTYHEVIEAQGQPSNALDARYLLIWKKTAAGWKIHRGMANTEGE